MFRRCTFRINIFRSLIYVVERARIALVRVSGVAQNSRRENTQSRCFEDLHIPSNSLTFVKSLLQNFGVIVRLTLRYPTSLARVSTSLFFSPHPPVLSPARGIFLCTMVRDSCCLLHGLPSPLVAFYLRMVVPPVGWIRYGTVHTTPVFARKLVIAGLFCGMIGYQRFRRTGVEGCCGYPLRSNATYAYVHCFRWHTPHFRRL